ncbi:MAG TPA: ATP-dependent DNA helicase [Candidatus Nanoarchaeia archaeon]|nr:ATP-dependent DNA helicase [Candidatus Nanoarchaeia archaeon]
MEQFFQIDKPMAILAGAGTGKTYTIVEKLKHLIVNNVFKPEKIVCITFSNEAAESISKRVLAAIDGEKKPIIRTFHGFSADLLREYGDRIGISKDFKILDPDRAKIVIHSNLKIPAYYCHKYIAAMGSAKDLGISLEDMEKHLQLLMKDRSFEDIEKRRESLQFDFQTLHLDKSKNKTLVTKELEELNEIVEFKKFVFAWRAYEKIKKKQNYQDYADLNSNASELLKVCPDISKEYEYVIVDEFQDTNKIQLDIIFNLAKKGNITVVGDLNQSIYRFRGAYRENFSEFKKHYSIGKDNILALDSSYRSSNKILRAAHKLIEHNYENKEDCFEVKSYNNREGDNIEVFELKNGREEARKVTEIIEKLTNDGMKLEDICVMVRTHQQSQVIKRVMEMKKIDYCSLDKPSLLKQKEVKMVVDYLIISNHLKSSSQGGEHSWWEIMYQSEFSAEDLASIGSFIKEKKKEDCLSKVLLENIESCKLSDEGKIKLKFILDKIKKIFSKVDLKIDELIQYCYSVLGYSSKELDDNSALARELNSFIDFAKSYAEFSSTDISSFIYHLGVLANLDINVDLENVQDGGVRIMTAHATKGLEYKAVIVTNMAQKRFPILRMTSNSLFPKHLHPEVRGLDEKTRTERIEEWEYHEQKNQIHEERRLCYVACTRAKEKLYFTYALDYSDKKHGSSQFLEEMQYKQNNDFVFTLDNDEKYPLLSVSVQNEELDKALITSGKEITFSPSALLLFDDCQKKYQYKYVYNMPDEEIVDWEAINLGSFVHLVLEEGVKEQYNTEKQFIDFARILHEKPEWEKVSLNDALGMIRVFFQRNKNKYSSSSKVEQSLFAEIEGLKFMGYADRIDIKDGEVEIIDYKTGRVNISPKHRRWQLGFYAFAATKYGKIKALTLDMLRLDKPLSFKVDSNGNAKSTVSDRVEGFNILEVKEELVDTARALQKAFKEGFKPCPVDKHCEFCNEYVYKLG